MPGVAKIVSSWNSCTNKQFMAKGSSIGLPLPWITCNNCCVILIMQLLHWAQNQRAVNLSKWRLKAQRTQAQYWVNFDFEVKFDFEGQGQSPPKPIEILTKVLLGTSCPNLVMVVVAWIGYKLLPGHTDMHMRTQTDASNDNTQRPKLALGKKKHSSELTEQLF